VFGLFSLFDTVVTAAVTAIMGSEVFGVNGERYQWTIFAMILIFGIAYLVVCIMLVIGSDRGKVKVFRSIKAY
jgi:hypothetical protein